jgi:hydrogenase maturation protein HypF
VISGPSYDSPEDFLKAGGILAIKDIGGYHLACDPFNKAGVASLRLLKHREAKAFAIMFADIEQVKEYCLVNAKEEELLTGPARPIVLLKRKKEFAENVCLTSPDVGAMLPCNPVQILLSKALGPLIMTSGNASGDVLETDNEAMEAWLSDRASSEEMAGVSLGILSHNRRILRPMDDSVMKVVKGRTQFIRRARGYVPNPISVDLDGELFAAGGDLKSSFCYVKNGLAYVSQYLGDMESVSCQQFYRVEKTAMETIFGFKPEAVAVDEHPGYFSKKANLNTALPVAEVQHHRAHVASVIAEQGLKGPVLGFAFDGTGYGDDGTIWGSEVFSYDGVSSMERIAHLQPMKLIGGNEGAKNCDTILTGFLHGNGIDMPTAGPESQLVKAALDNNINCVTSTSMGRLFDAVSALLDICHYNSYEGQAPIELENIARSADKGYLLTIGQDGSTKKLFLEIITALENNVPKNEIAKGFIEAVSDFICTTAEQNSWRLDEKKQVVLSGGTFLNRLLLESAIDRLEAFGFNVYTAEQLPPGDGGICLGQAFILRNFVIK